MSFNILVRKKQLQSLDQYISSSKNKVQSMLDYLGWSPKKVSAVDDTLNCPFNTGHKIQVAKIQKHVEKCCLLTSGYQLDDKYLSEPQNDPKSSILIDNSKKIEILNEARNANSKFRPGWTGLDPDPMTGERLISTYSPDERLALYNYSVQNTEAPPEPSEFNLNINDLVKKEGKELTEEEQRQKERNSRRRRIKYKSVHTGRNKSHTEVMREVIDNQMDMYQEYLINKQKLEDELARERELLDVDEQFDQPDASNLIYDFDDANASGDPSLANHIPIPTNSGSYKAIASVGTHITNPYSLENYPTDPYNAETNTSTLESSFIDNTSYDYQEYIQNILSQPQNEYDQKIREYSKKVNQLRILKERDRKNDHYDHHDRHDHRDQHDHRSRRERSSHREKERRHSQRDYRNGHGRRYSRDKSRDGRDRRDSHHRSDRRH